MPGQQFLRDLRFAVRILMKDARFSILAILGLALGIGVSTGIFAIMGPMLKGHGSNVRPFEEVRNPETYVGVDRGPSRNLSFPEYRYFQDHSTTLMEISAESAPVSLVLNPISEGEAEDVLATFESATSISVLGMRPELGRSFSREEEQPGTPPVVILSYRFWQRRFGGNKNVLGKTIVLNAHAATIIGVADIKFHEEDTTTIFLPLGLQPVMLDQGNGLHDSEATWLMVNARLRPGISLTQGQAEANVLGTAFAENTHPGTGQFPDRRVSLSPGAIDRQQQRIRSVATVVVNLIVAMILMIACSNLANLLLARAVVRRREIGVRLSLGASRARLICQLLTESLLLSIAGGAVGLVFSFWLVKAISLAVFASVAVLGAGTASQPPGSSLRPPLVGCHRVRVWLGACAGGHENKSRAGPSRGRIVRNPQRAFAEDVVSTQFAGSGSAGRVADAARSGLPCWCEGFAERALRTEVRYLSRDRHVVPAESAGL